MLFFADVLYERSLVRKSNLGSASKPRNELHEFIFTFPYCIYQGCSHKNLEYGSYLSNFFFCF